MAPGFYVGVFAIGNFRNAAGPIAAIASGGGS